MQKKTVNKVLACFELKSSVGKVKVFWEGHKNLKKSPNSLTLLSTSVKKLGDFFEILWPSQNMWTLRNFKECKF